MILQNGGNVAILDLNADNGKKAAGELGPSARFFACDVTSSESISEAVKGTVAWIAETGKSLGGIVPAAGIATPATVRIILQDSGAGLRKWRTGKWTNGWCVTKHS